MFSLRRCCLDCAYDLGQHLAQPAAFVQHLAQVAESLQQLPLHFMAGMVHEALLSLQQVEHPVVISIPAAKTAVRIIIVFMLFFLWFFADSWLPIAFSVANTKCSFVTSAF
jgi:hypothetical protein